MTSFGHTGVLRVNGTDLAIREAGIGTPLVLVHGGVADMRTWSNQFEPLSAQYRLLAYSRRYALPNPPLAPDAPDPIQTHIDDLAELIAICDAAPAHVVGHSWGGLIVLMLALQRPELLRSLVLVEPPMVSLHVRIPPKIGDLAALFLRAPRLAVAIARLGARALGPAEKAFRRGDDKTAIERFGRGVLGARAFEALSPGRYQQIWDNRGPDRALALYQGFPDLASADPSRLSLPVLLVGGDDSPAVFRLLMDDFAAKLPASRRSVIAGASHIVHEDAPLAFNEAVLDFLGDIDQEASATGSLM